MLGFLKKDQNTLIAIYVLLLSIGCFWQIFNVCDLYFKYPTNVFIETTFDPLTKTVPTLTFVKNIGSHSGQNSTEALKNASRLIKNELFSEIYFSNSTDNSTIKMEYMDNAIERISFNFYSITFNSLITVDKCTEIKGLESLNFIFNNYGSSDTSWWMFFHNSYDIPASNEWNAISLNKGYKYQATWKLSAFRLLKRPYGTDCKDYRKSSDYLSRRDCIRHCKLDNSLKECKVVYEGVDMGKGERSILFGDNQCTKELNLEEICRNSCSHFDCVIDYYKPTIVNSYKGGDETSLKIIFPSGPETAYYLEPKMATVEFICYLASTFSMWFGLSMYSLYYLLITCRNKLFEHGVLKRPRYKHPQTMISKETLNYLKSNKCKPIIDGELKY